MMIHALRYEPQGQRQRFEPREQQEQDRHIHLHFHLNLTFRARQERSTQPNAMRITRIVAALLAATVMHLVLFLFFLQLQDPAPLLTLGNLAWVMLFAGLALAWGVGGLSLPVSAWRASPSVRFVLLGLLLSIPLFLQFGSWFGPFAGGLLLSLFFLQPLITALLLLWVSLEARVLRQTAPTHTRHGFVVVSGMVLTLLGGLLLNLSFMLGGAPLGWVVFFLEMCAAIIAVIVAFCTLFGLSHSPENTQACPKDASPFDVDSFQAPRGYRGIGADLSGTLAK